MKLQAEIGLRAQADKGASAQADGGHGDAMGVHAIEVSTGMAITKTTDMPPAYVPAGRIGVQDGACTEMEQREGLATDASTDQRGAPFR